MSVVVTQADREAAAAFSEQVVGKTNGHDHIAECRNGQRDETHIVQAFARHRTEAIEELVRALTETARDMREAGRKLREFGAVLSADILCAQAAKSEAAIARARGEQE